MFSFLKYLLFIYLGTRSRFDETKSGHVPTLSGCGLRVEKHKGCALLKTVSGKGDPQITQITRISDSQAVWVHDPDPSDCGGQSLSGDMSPRNNSGFKILV